MLAMPFPRRRFKRLITSERIRNSFSVCSIGYKLKMGLIILNFRCCFIVSYFESQREKKEKCERRIGNTSEVESLRRGERDLHEMGVLKLAIPGKIVNDRDFPLRFGLWFSPDFGSLRAGVSVFPLLRDLEL